MNRRTFLRLCSTLIATSAASPMGSWGTDEKLHNWAGNFEYGTARQYFATSLDEVRNFVRANTKLKVLGTRHCFNNIADSTDQFLSLRQMQKVVEVDEHSHTVTIEPGIRYGELCQFLDGKGWALHNLASLPHISVAGACSTGTHGSGEKNGNLSTAVSGIEIVTSNGAVMKLSRTNDGDEFRGSVVGLGAVGVLTKVALDIQPRFTMKQYVYENLPLEQLESNFDAIQSSAYSVSLFTDWQRRRINEVWLKIRTDETPGFDGPPDFFGAVRATRNLHPIADLSAENCTEQMGVPGPWYERLPHFRMGFTPSAGKELQSEYFIPRAKAIDAILAVERLRDRVGPHLLISEIRTIAADDLWMSPCYRRASVSIHFTWKQEWPAVSKLLPLIEKELEPYHPRPHWGKLFTMSPQKLRSSYERIDDFTDLCTKYDSRGKFRNKFLNRMVFAKA